MKTQNKIKRSDKKGSSLVEALVSMAIISYVIVSILSGFSQQQADTQKNTERNTAIMLAERRIEELMKLPSGQLVDNDSYVDHIVPKPQGYEYYGEGITPPDVTKQIRRTTTITKDDILGQLATITVTVEYGAQYSGIHLIYPYRVQLTSRRSLK